MDGAGAPDAGGDDHAAAAGLVRGGDGGGDGGGVGVGRGVCAGLGAKVGDGEIAIREDGGLDAGEDFGVVLPAAGLEAGAGVVGGRGGGRGGAEVWGAEELVHLGAGGDEGADALVVVLDDGLADVVGEGAVARMAAFAHAAEAGDLATLEEADGAVGVGADEVLDHAGVALAEGGQVFVAREVAAVDALRESIVEHGGGGALQVVALAGALVGDLPPDAGGGILPAHDALGDSVENLGELVHVGVGDGKVFEGVNEGHGIPADGAAPEAGGFAGDLVGPGLGAGLVPGVVVELFVGVPRVTIHQDELPGDVVVEGGLVKGLRVVGEEGRGHEEAVEPHLMRVALFVPEAALAGARVGAHLVAQLLDGGAQGGRAVAVLPGADEDLAGGDEVDVVVGFPIRGDGAVGGHEGGGGAFAVGGVGRVAGVGGEALEGEADERHGVGPLGLGVDVVELFLADAGHLGLGHAHGPLQRGGVAEGRRRGGWRRGGGGGWRVAAGEEGAGEEQRGETGERGGEVHGGKGGREG